MGVIAKVLLVVFIIVCVLLVLLVAIQDDGENGMGGLLGGRGTAAFGSHSASVLTKTTFVLVVLFFGLAVSLAVINKQNVNINIDSDTTTEEPADTQTQDQWWEEKTGEVNQAVQTFDNETTTAVDALNALAETVENTQDAE
ncbi:MAG: preprotein translocase subunit SecG [Treponema sp.]|nr:preprotein translocase subunit SecG [Treponema sp.]